MTIQTKKNRALRFVALLCLLALTVGCAACATDRTESSTGESVAGVDSVDSAMSDGSGGAESNAEQSEESGEPSDGVSFDQSAEELMVPVGTKTKVEKLASYPIGVEEAFQYAFECGIPFDPEEAYSPTIPFHAQIDENEDLYLGYWWETATRLRDGKQWESTDSWRKSYPENAFYSCFVISGEYLYMVYDNGVVEQYDMEGNLVKLHTGCADRKLDVAFACVDADGQVFLKAGNQSRYYRLDGTELPKERMPFRIGTAESDVQYAPSAFSAIVQAHGSVFVSEQTRYPHDGNGNYEQLYSVCHADGTLLSNFRFTVQYSYEKSPCTLPHGINYTYFSTASIDDTVFEHVLDGEVIVGTNGSLYLALFLENEVELYRITPGHTEGLKFSKPKEQADAA